ncbi:MAG: hypothetical protein Q7K57_36870 [Burkholderiaceae bacterium]|nr:hypothetical protein [Burkholderiaceae bacterium]
MNPSILSAAEKDQLRRAMSYWAAHWDWECPTLFGIELEELQVVLEAWPHCAVEKEVEASAAIGALRELLYGASTPPKGELPQIMGVEYEAASALCDKVYALYREHPQQQQ